MDITENKKSTLSEDKKFLLPMINIKLVIAEKPSVAQSIAKVIGADKREDGYLEGKRLCLKMENLSETQRSK